MFIDHRLCKIIGIRRDKLYTYKSLSSFKYEDSHLLSYDYADPSRNYFSYIFDTTNN